MAVTRMLSGLSEGGMTFRASVIGCLIGCLMCFSNTYFGLMTGFVTMASTSSALLGFGVWALVMRLCGTRLRWLPLTLRENVIIQTIAVAAATMPLAAGFVGIIPALRILESKGEAQEGVSLPLQSAGDQIAWCLSVCFIGVFMAVPLRFYVMTLRYPSGTATAVAIQGLHGKQAAKAVGSEASPNLATTETMAVQVASVATDGESVQGRDAELAYTFRAAGYSFLASSGLTALAFCFPVLGAVPIATYLQLPAVTSWGWTLTVSFSYAGQGIIMGLPTCISMMAGAICGWGVIGPAAQSAGWLTGGNLSSNPGGGKAFILWVSLAIMLSEAAAGASITVWHMARGCSWARVVNACSPEGRGVRPDQEGGTVVVSLGPTSNRGARGSGDKMALMGHAGTSGSAGELSALHDEAAVEHPIGSASKGNDEAETRPILLAAAGGKAMASSHSASRSAVHPAAAARGTAAAAVPPHRASTAAAPPSPVLPAWAWVGGLLVCSAAAVAALVPLAHVSPLESLCAVLLSAPIAVVAVRALGETDLNPVSGLGKITQVAFGALFPHSLVGNVIAGAVAEAGAQQAGDLMQDLKTGWLTGAPLPAQFAGQLLGSLVSVFAATGAFRLFDGAYGVPSPSLPAPTAAIWVSMAELMDGGSLPPQVVPLMAAAAALSFAIAVAQVVRESNENSLLQQQQPAAREAGSSGGVGSSCFAWLAAVNDRYAGYLPSPTAFAVGMYVTPNWSLPRLLGASAAAVCARRFGVSTQTLIMVATGFVLGEGLLSLVTAGAAAAGARPVSCGGCAAGACGNFCP